MNIGLYFGTFNPIHVGHLIIAEYMTQQPQLDKVWFVVSPKNPFKQKDTLLEDYHRLALIKEAIDDNPNLAVSNIEFNLPKPSYTTTTLVHLREKYPDHTFHLIMGEDNLRTFHKWNNYEEILAHHKLFVYPRIDPHSGNKAYPMKGHPAVTAVDAPVMNLSASFIRKSLKAGKDVTYMLTPAVLKYVKEMHFYE